MPKSTADLAKQIESLQKYLRTLRTGVKRAQAEPDILYFRRNWYPLEMRLKLRRAQDHRDLEMIARACLDDLRKVQFLRASAFQPGDQIIAAMKGSPEREARYAIFDINPEPRRKFSFAVIGITKRGKLSERYSYPIDPARYSLRACDDRLHAEAADSLRWWRERNEAFMKAIVEDGPLEMYEIEEMGYASRQVKRKALGAAK